MSSKELTTDQCRAVEQETLIALRKMDDTVLINYSRHIHVSLDSMPLIVELARRLEEHVSTNTAGV